MVKNPPANARDTGSIPGPGRVYMPRGNWACKPQLLDLCYCTCEPQLLMPMGSRACAPQQEVTAVRSRCTSGKDEPPATTTRESPRAATDTQHNQKLINLKLKQKKPSGWFWCTLKFENHCSCSSPHGHKTVVTAPNITWFLKMERGEKNALNSFYQESKKFPRTFQHTFPKTP